MPRQPSLGPRYVVANYLVKVRGEHGCSVLSNPYSAAGQVGCYLSSRPGGACDVTYYEQCGHCKGHGRIAGKRRMSWLPCKHCKGQPELFSYTFTPDDLKTLMRLNQSAWLAA